MTSADWAAWFTAIGTVGAFATGGVLLIRGLRRDHERALAQIRDQATRVTAWVVANGQSELTFTIKNTSDVPVYDAAIITTDDNERVGNYNMGLIPGLDYVSIPVQSSQTRYHERPEALPFSFTDSAGKRWLRDGLGILYEGSRENLDALEFPGGIVGGASAAQRHYQANN